MALILAALLVVAGCGGGGESSPPAKGKANLRVTVVAKPKTGAKPFRSYQPSEAEKAAKAASTGNFELVDYEHLADVVVWLEPAGATTTKAAADVTIPIVAKSQPALVAVSAGDVVTLRNDRPQPLRVYSVSEGNEFNLGELAPGAGKVQPLRGAGLVEVLDDATFEVVARVYVVPGVHARVTRAGEAVTFRDLDPGKYRVAAWHERLPGDGRDVTLSADAIRELDLLIGVNALPKVE